MFPCYSCKILNPLLSSCAGHFDQVVIPLVFKIYEEGRGIKTLVEKGHQERICIYPVDAVRETDSEIYKSES